MQFRWQFPPERETKNLRAKGGNKNKIEASIAEAYLNEEVLNFTTKYYNDNSANPEDLPQLSLYASAGGKASGTNSKQLQHAEWLTIHSYILNNMLEVKPYIK